MLSSVISRLIILLFGTLYPAYASYKAIKTKNVKEYVKWMMYWIVFAFFTCIETFADIFISWFPFYYEVKIVFVLWLLSPATKGSSILYMQFVHPQLTKREPEIDAYIAKASEQGYHTVVKLGAKGLSFASEFVLRAAVKGQATIADHLKRSYSLNDLSDDMPEPSESNEHMNNDEADNRFSSESYEKEMYDKDLSPLLHADRSANKLTQRHAVGSPSKELLGKGEDLNKLDKEKKSKKPAKETKEVSNYGTVPRNKSTGKKSRLTRGTTADS